MSREQAWVVGLPADIGLLSLVADVRSAAERAAKADPGDRLDIARFEALASRLEQAALNLSTAPRTPVESPGVGTTMLFGTDPNAWPRDIPEDIRNAANSYVRAQLLPVLLVDPYVHGQTPAGSLGRAEGPARPWKAADGVFGGRAVEARFRAQIEDALNPDTRRRTSISPSGISNPIVTEILREFVAAKPGSNPVNAAVEYRDGSKSAHPFPLRALTLTDGLPGASLDVKFAMLSIRHTEMDAVVHGAWLRNVEISRRRLAAQTDDLVYEISIKQLEELCRNERHVRLHMYQTGLETAVVGFYRALTVHLLRYPDSISVQPMYFVPPPRPKRARQRPASEHLDAPHSVDRHGTKSPRRQREVTQGNRHSDGGSTDPRSRAGQAQVLPEGSTFRKGTVWSTSHR